jgi:hypothetical protein
MKKTSRWAVVLVLMSAPSAWAVPVNTLTIREAAGVSTNDYPVQIARPFVEGEIAGCPQILLNGVLAPHQQASVKGRYPGGSIKHAVFNFYIPTLSVGQTVTASFQNGPGSGTCEGTPLTSAEMLDSGAYNFDASMSFTGDVAGAVSARSMLTNGHYSVWLAGSKATSIILADHSASAIYDMGTTRAFRPIFHATFWPRIGKVHVRFIGEAANTERLQDLAVTSVALTTGHDTPQKVYSKSAFTHFGRSRWTKEFWIGGAPPKISINHNIAYLASTKSFPNHDPSKVVPASDGGWPAVSKDLFDAGNWQKSMAAPGGRPDIGPFPAWTIRWLYTGDERLREQAFGNADLAAAWPVHFREGNPAKSMNGFPGLGRPLAVTNRPTFRQWKKQPQWDDSADKVLVTGPLEVDEYAGWSPDGAHQPDPFSPQYALTGDFWYLEEMYFFASWSAARHSHGNNAYFSRGPTGSEGGLSEETRGEAWVFRNRAQTAYWAPDGSPEKAYFEKLLMDAIAVWEGRTNVRGTSFQGTPLWTWGNTIGVGRFGGAGVPLLHVWDKGIAGYGASVFVDPGKTDLSDATWMYNFLIYSLGRAQELGYPTDSLLTWTGDWLNGQISDPGYDPYLSGAYTLPVTRKTDGKFFSDWADVKAAFRSPFVENGDGWCNGPPTCTPAEFFNGLGKDGDHGYAFIAMAAASMVADRPGGASSWAWMAANALNSPALDVNPKWAILPRGTSTVPGNGKLSRPRRMRGQ